jgi:hypothetical protein
MWNTDQLTLVIEIIEGNTIQVAITTPAGLVLLLGDVTFEGELLRIDGAHIDGPGRGSLKRAGLNAIARKLVEFANVKKVCVQGGTRGTGRRKGTIPRLICFPHD